MPSHILDHQERAISHQDVIQQTMRDNGFLGALDNARQNRKSTRRRIVGIENTIGTFHPIGRWCMDSGLHVRTIEVDGTACREVVEGARKPEDVVKEGTGCGYLVDIEAGISQ